MEFYLLGDVWYYLFVLFILKSMFYLTYYLQVIFTEQAWWQKRASMKKPPTHRWELVEHNPLRLLPFTTTITYKQMGKALLLVSTQGTRYLATEIPTHYSVFRGLARLHYSNTGYHTTAFKVHLLDMSKCFYFSSPEYLCETYVFLINQPSSNNIQKVKIL